MNAQLDIFKLITQQNFEITNYTFIPSIKHKLLIDDICKNLKDTFNIDVFVCCIVFGNKKYFLSNTASNIAIPYSVLGLDRLDNTFTSFGKMPGINYPHPQTYLEEEFQRFLHEAYNLTNTFLYYCKDKWLEIFFLASHNAKIIEANKFFALIKNSFLNFCCDFVESTKEIIFSLNPFFKQEKFFTDCIYRKNILYHLTENNSISLTPQESVCLKLFAEGYTSKEIATKQNISVHTVYTHSKSILKKLNISNMNHAIYLAYKNKLLK